MSCGPNLNIFESTTPKKLMLSELFGLNPAVWIFTNFNQDWPLCVFGARDRVWVVAG